MVNPKTFSFRQIVVALSVLSNWAAAQLPALGESSGGAIPEIVVVSCKDALHIGRGVALNAQITEKTLTDKAVSVRVASEFVKNQVHFYNTATPFHLYLDTEPTAGSYAGTLSLGTRKTKVSCEFLHDSFRPLSPRHFDVEFFHGGTRCAPKETAPMPPGVGRIPCVGSVGGMTPSKRTIATKFENGRLEGSWQEVKEIFGVKVAFAIKLSQHRGGAVRQELQISRQDDPNPTTVALEGLNQMVELQTPALALGKDTLQIWQRIRVREIPTKVAPTKVLD